ncbi:MAG: hypothetical protein ACM359_12945 [Bacillota bacterium]
MHNPLAILCSQLGLTDVALARILGCPPGSVREALAEEPKEPLRTYLRLGLVLGAKTRLVADAPLRLWFDLGAIDELHYSNEFRSAVGLDPLPANRGELRQVIKKLRRRGLSYADIADRLQANFIPTATGVRTWRRSTIAQHVKIKVSGEDALMPLGMTDEFRLAIKSHVRSQLLVAMCPFDPFASVRYEIQQTERDGLLMFETTSPLPASIRRWIVAAVARLGWFKPDQWGEGKHGEVQGQSLQRAEEGRSAQLPLGGAGEAEAREAGGLSPIDQHRAAHHPDHLPGSDGGRGEADPVAA